MEPKFLDSMKDGLKSLSKRLSGFWIDEKATVVIPAFNEEKTVLKVVQTALKSRFVDEVIVVDDGSTDKTAEKAKGLPRTRVILHQQNLGKGRALKTGLENASNDVILFLDADLQNITVEKIDGLLLPLLQRKADFVKAGFSLSRGRVTEFAVKPMMRVLFPEREFSQPISGQFAARKSFLSEMKFEDRWGIDIAIFLDALKKNMRVLEVDIGKLEHKARTTEEKAEMSKQVLATMLKKTGLFADIFKAVVFSESVLFSGNRPKKDVKLIVKQLQKRKYKVIILGYSDKDVLAEKAANISLDDYMAMNQGMEPEKLLNLFKRLLKKNGVKAEEAVLVAAKPCEARLLEAAGLGISFGKVPALKEKANKTIESLAEILLVESERE